MSKNKNQYALPPVQIHQLVPHAITQQMQETTIMVAMAEHRIKSK